MRTGEGLDYRHRGKESAEDRKNVETKMCEKKEGRANEMTYCDKEAWESTDV